MKDRTIDKKRQFLRAEKWHTGFPGLDKSAALPKVLLSLVMHMLQLTSHNSAKQTHRLLVRIKPQISLIHMIWNWILDRGLQKKTISHKLQCFNYQLHPEKSLFLFQLKCNSQFVLMQHIMKYI